MDTIRNVECFKNGRDHAEEILFACFFLIAHHLSPFRSTLRRRGPCAFTMVYRLAAVLMTGNLAIFVAHIEIEHDLSSLRYEQSSSIGR